MNPAVNSFRPSHIQPPPQHQTSRDLATTTKSASTHALTPPTMEEVLKTALSDEQRAHQLTKESLEIVTVAMQDECEKGLKLEARVEKLKQHNKSLTAAVGMCESIVKNLETKLNDKTKQKVPTAKENGHMPGAVKENIQESQNTPQEHNGQPQVDLNGEKPRVTSAELFNLDQFNATNLDNAGTDSTLAQTFRRHFMDANEFKVAELPRPPPEERETTLVQITPPKKSPNSQADVADGTTVSPSKIQTPARKPRIIPEPFSPTVYWKVHSRNPIFDDDDDKIDRLGMPSWASNKASEFYCHPVRYMPDITDKNLYRTIMIDGIPIGATYRDVLPHIRGGALESIQLFGPIGTVTNFMTARIVFSYELGAQSVVDYARANPIIIKDNKVRVWMVLQPTYPRNAELCNDIFTRMYTRFLLIDNVSDAVLDLLPSKLARQIDRRVVVGIGQAHDGIPLVEFTSVVEASRALNLLVIDPQFGGAEFDFDDDPCAEDYA